MKCNKICHKLEKVKLREKSLFSNVFNIESPSQHAAGLVGGAAAAETGEEGEEGEEDEGDDDEGEVGRVGGVRLGQARLNVLACQRENKIIGRR